jgi:hypothetical protein
MTMILQSKEFILDALILQGLVFLEICEINKGLDSDKIIFQTRMALLLFRNL